MLELNYFNSIEYDIAYRTLYNSIDNKDTFIAFLVAKKCDLNSLFPKITMVIKQRGSKVTENAFQMLPGIVSLFHWVMDDKSQNGIS